ncbi:MAG: YgiT-type zinc finger protein [Tepidisphaeraceae bacterium]
MLDIRICPTCGSKRIRVVCRSVTRNFKGRSYEVPDVQFHECPDCGEKLYGREAMQKLESYRPKLKASA